MACGRSDLAQFMVADWARGTEPVGKDPPAERVRDMDMMCLLCKHNWPSPPAASVLKTGVQSQVMCHQRTKAFRGLRHRAILWLMDRLMD